MNLQSKYLGMTLNSPFVLSASPIGENVENLKRLEDYGVGAVVLHSLFEEQLADEQLELEYHLTHGTESFAEATSFFPNYDEFRLGPDQYLEQIHKAKNTLKVPVIASLNGTSKGGWTKYAKNLQDAGADALELNIYNVPTDINLDSAQIENAYVDIVKQVKSNVNIPVAVKLSPYFTNMANMLHRMDTAGADAFVLFNRFYQPDINLHNYQVDNKVSFSTSENNRIAMRWIAIMKNKINAEFAATGGIITAQDAAKLILAGANVTQIFATIARNGMEYVKVLVQELIEFMEEKGYSSIEEMIGVVSQKNIPNPGSYERAQYMKTLSNYKF
ncbi:MAG: dihydroorotate dehydrogenase [Ignavibacteria bacterium GWF2_33_9]|nr:MAG: dihydroorotate dehydrogenase [Ignavibacteria bacterium GWF2_33_9]